MNKKLLVPLAVFLVLTGLVWRWSRRIRDQFAPQDDLVEIETATVEAEA